MSKLRRLVFVITLFFVLFPSAARARDPREALSERADGSVYLVLRMDDLGGMLRSILSPENVEMLTSFMTPEEAGGVRLAANLVAQLPVRSVAFVAGTGADKKPFLQAAASVGTKESQGKLDLVASGKAKPEDLVTLLLGEGGLLFAAGMPPLVVQQGERGPYYLIGNGNDRVAISARDDLLVMALSPEGLQQSLKALEDEKKRLVLKRRFDSPAYYYLHIDMATAAAFSDKMVSGDVDLQALKKMFKAPLNVEVGFESKPGSFLMSAAVNVFEALAAVERFRDIRPVTGANMFLAGEGQLFFGIAGATYFSADDLKVYPEVVRVWNKIAGELSKRGITESDVENLLTGSFSLVAGSRATIMGQAVPGMYVALNGRKGAASRFLDVILNDEDFAKAVPVAPVKAKGWDRLVMVDPSLFPVPLLLGVRDDTLFAGIIDSAGIEKKPELSPEAAKLLEGKLFASGFLDTNAIWNYLRREAGSEASHLGSALKMLPPALSNVVRDILDADLPVSFVKLWAPTLDTSFTEFSLVDVPQEKRLLPRLMKAAEMVNAMESGSDDESSLAILLAVRGEVEAEIARNPGVTVEELESDLGDLVAFMETASGDLYIGVQVAGDAEKLEVIEQTQVFGLTGSAGPGLAPDGSPYDGQEIVWVKIDR